MSESETALSTAINVVGVNSASAFNTPASGTPIPAHTLSNETFSLLDSVAEKLLKEKKSANRPNKRKRSGSPSSDRESTSRERYSECGLQYIGETKRPLRQRMYEHFRSVQNKKLNNSTPVSRYFSSPNHSSQNIEFSELYRMRETSNPNDTKGCRGQE